MNSLICAVLIGGVWGVISDKIGMSWQSIEWVSVLFFLNMINVMVWNQIEK